MANKRISELDALLLLPADTDVIPIVNGAVTKKVSRQVFMGITGIAVGTDDVQTLTNKSIDLASNTLTGTLAQFNTALSGADFASLAGTETLTNKTIALGSNTVSGTLAQFNTAVTDADLASIAGTETLTNKTLTSPVINQFGAASGLGAGLDSWTPTWTNLTVGNGTFYTKYKQIGPLVFYVIFFQFGSTTTIGASNPRFTPPVTAIDPGIDKTNSVINYGVGLWGGFDASVPTTFGNVFNYVIMETTTSFRIFNLTTTAPMTWATGDQFFIQDWYWAA